MLEDMGLKLYNMGIEAVSQNNISGALDFFEKALGFKPGHPDCLNAAGLCCFELGDFKKAAYFWKRSLQIDTDGNSAGKYLEYLDGDEFKAYVSSYNKILDHIYRREYIRALIGMKALKKLHAPLDLINIRGLLFYRLGLKRTALKQWRRVIGMDCSNRNAIGYILKSSIGSVASKVQDIPGGGMVGG